MVEDYRTKPLRLERLRLTWTLDLLSPGCQPPPVDQEDHVGQLSLAVGASGE